jgi:hypothetical protein
MAARYRDVPAALEGLARRIARIKPPGTRNPHAFHEDRSEVASYARAIGEWARTGVMPNELLEMEPEVR